MLSMLGLWINDDFVMAGANMKAGVDTRLVWVWNVDAWAGSGYCAVSYLRPFILLRALPPD